MMRTISFLIGIVIGGLTTQLVYKDMQEPKAMANLAAWTYYLGCREFGEKAICKEKQIKIKNNLLTVMEIVL